MNGLQKEKRKIINFHGIIIIEKKKEKILSFTDEELVTFVVVFPVDIVVDVEGVKKFNIGVDVVFVIDLVDAGCEKIDELFDVKVLVVVEVGNKDGTKDIGAEEPCVNVVAVEFGIDTVLNKNDDNELLIDVPVVNTDVVVVVVGGGGWNWNDEVDGIFDMLFMLVVDGIPNVND